MTSPLRSGCLLRHSVLTITNMKMREISWSLQPKLRPGQACLRIVLSWTPHTPQPWATKRCVRRDLVKVGTVVLTSIPSHVNATDWVIALCIGKCQKLEERRKGHENIRQQWSSTSKIIVYCSAPKFDNKSILEQWTKSPRTSGECLRGRNENAWGDPHCQIQQ